MNSLIRRLREPAITIALVAAWLTVFANQTFFSQVAEWRASTGQSTSLFVLGTGLLVWGVFNLVLQWLGWGALTRAMLTLMLLVSAFTAHFVDNFGIRIDADMVRNVLETDSHEARDLMSWSLLGNVAWMAGLPLLWLWWRPLTRQAWWPRQRQRVLASLASVLVIVGIAASSYADYASLFRNHRELRHVLVPQNAFNGLRKALKTETLGPVVVSPYGEDAHRLMPAGRHKPRLLVLVLGETARAESFSLNGNPRPVTPELARRAVINFSQVSSCGTATAVSVPCLFSGMTRADYDPVLARQREGLLDIVQRAGYAVSWIENSSGCKGVCDRVEQVSATDAIRARWCGADGCLDELLVDTLADQLRTQPARDRVIVLHQQGSHGPAYGHRYPAAFRRFTPTCDSSELSQCSAEAVRNSYENTIAYTDHVLARVIDTVSGPLASAYDSSFLYVSDHGESTGEHGLYLHGAPYLLAPSQQTHVPMLAWLSDGYRAREPARSQCLAQQRKAEWSHDNVFHTVLGLLDVRTQVKVPGLDIGAHCRQLAVH